jgi:hypothetical protein
VRVTPESPRVLVAREIPYKPNPAETSSSKKHTVSHVVPLDQIHSAPLLGKRKLGDYETEANEMVE